MTYYARNNGLPIQMRIPMLRNKQPLDIELNAV